MLLDPQDTSYPSKYVRKNAAFALGEMAFPHEDVVAALIARNADINERSPLTLAASHGFTGVMRLLIDAGASLTQFCGDTAVYCNGLEGAPNALHAASELAHPEAVQLLLDSGADPRVHNYLGQNATHLARQTARRCADDPAGGEAHGDR